MKMLKIIAVKAKWTYENNKSSNAKSLPVFIKIDLEFESDKICLNLIKQSKRSIRSPLVMTQFEGQRSVLKPEDDEVSTPYALDDQKIVFRFAFRSFVRNLK